MVKLLNGNIIGGMIGNFFETKIPGVPVMSHNVEKLRGQQVERLRHLLDKAFRHVCANIRPPPFIKTLSL